MSNQSKIIGRHAYQNLATAGAAAGQGNRARTFRSGKEKANDPRRMRKERHRQMDW